MPHRFRGEDVGRPATVFDAAVVVVGLESRGLRPWLLTVAPLGLFGGDGWGRAIRVQIEHVEAAPVTWYLWYRIEDQKLIRRDSRKETGQSLVS